MFWRSKREDEPEKERSLPSLAELREQDLAVLFKHSESCATSWAAQSQVRKFAASHPEVPVYTISVRQDRELSREIAAAIGIRHESPQVIVFRRGEAVANASHQDVTVGFLEEQCLAAE